MIWNLFYSPLRSIFLVCYSHWFLLLFDVCLASISILFNVSVFMPSCVSLFQSTYQYILSCLYPTCLSISNLSMYLVLFVCSLSINLFLFVSNLPINLCPFLSYFTQISFVLWILADKILWFCFIVRISG